MGAGGIGMANLERYFLAQGYSVAGYDRVESDLSKALVKEGAHIIYVDDPALIPEPRRCRPTTAYSPISARAASR